VHSLSTVYYTGKGDDGTTGVLSGKRLRKDDALIEAIGNIDELNSAIGIAITHVKDKTVEGHLKSIQNILFILGANLASANERKLDKAQISPNSLVDLESYIKAIGDKIPELKKFVLPGGSKASAHLHMARAVARRCERSIITAKDAYNIDIEVLAYVNRLSSYLFAAALYLNLKEGIAESHPTY
jgi:cob(I)alamin adenosyltransferase